MTSAVLPRHVRHGATAGGQFSLQISAESAGWGYSGLRVLSLAEGGRASFATGDDEVIVNLIPTDPSYLHHRQHKL